MGKRKIIVISQSWSNQSHFPLDKKLGFRVTGNRPKFAKPERPLKYPFEQCSFPLLPAELLDQYVWYYLLHKLGIEDKEATYGLIIQEQADDYNQKIKAIQQKIDGIQQVIVKKQRQIKNLDDLMTDEEFETGEFKKKYRTFTNEIMYLKQGLEEANKQLVSIHQLRDDQELLAKFVNNKEVLRLENSIVLTCVNARTVYRDTQISSFRHVLSRNPGLLPSQENLWTPAQKLCRGDEREFVTLTFAIK